MLRPLTFKEGKHNLSPLNNLSGDSSLKAICHIASPTCWRPTSWRHIPSFQFLLWTRRVHPAVLTECFSDLQKRFPSFISILVRGSRWGSQYLLMPAQILIFSQWCHFFFHFLHIKSLLKQWLTTGPWCHRLTSQYDVPCGQLRPLRQAAQHNQTFLWQLQDLPHHQQIQRHC